MSSDTYQTSVVIDSSLLEVFDYVADPARLPEWIPFYSAVERVPGSEAVGPSSGLPALAKGDQFDATLSLLPELATKILPGLHSLPLHWTIRVCIDDLVHGRRIAYRARDVSWTTICDFEPADGRTILTTTQSLWSVTGLAANYWMGPMQALGRDVNRRILEGLKRRLEGRAVTPVPRIFLSYRRLQEPYVAGRLFDALSSEFGQGTVFRDTDSLVAGGDWQGDINSAIRNCKVIVAYISEDWERELVKRANGKDGLRDELEVGLENEAIRFIPVVTSAKGPIDLNDRLRGIQQKLERISSKAPNLSRVFATALQAQRLRPDPDFRVDLEQLMRSVWYAFRVPRTSADAKRPALARSQRARAPRRRATHR